MAEEDDNDLIEIEDDEEDGEKNVYIKYNYIIFGKILFE